MGSELKFTANLILYHGIDRFDDRVYYNAH